MKWWAVQDLNLRPPACKVGRTKNQQLSWSERKVSPKQLEESI